MNGTRSKLMLVAVVLALSAYVPACCCWMETVSAWVVGTGERGGVHACCGHQDDGCGGDDDSGADVQRDGRKAPVHVTECGCGVQYRIGMQVQPTVLDFAPAVLMWVGMPLDAGNGLGMPAIVRREESARGAGRGERTLLRLHCALTV